MKFHSLAMMSQGSIPGTVDESYLPGLAVCADDSSPAIRSVTAQLLGRYFVQGKKTPNPEALELLIKLSGDESSDVRFNAVYYGLSQIQDKSDDTLNLLIDIATKQREQSLYDRIAESLSNDRERAAAILDRKLQDDDNIAIYEIYEDMTGQKPANADKYLAMPSSRPRLFIFTGEGSDPEVVKTELEKALKAEGIENPDVRVSDAGENYVLFLKVYITKDYLTVEKAFSDHPEFKITQEMWLTPEMEIQIEAMQKMKP
jgi:HEAT repeat protein